MQILIQIEGVVNDYADIYGVGPLMFLIASYIARLYIYSYILMTSGLGSHPT